MPVPAEILDTVYQCVFEDKICRKKKQILNPKTHWHKFSNFLNLEKHAVVHVNYKNYGLVMIDLGDDAILHVNYE